MFQNQTDQFSPRFLACPGFGIQLNVSYETGEDVRFRRPVSSDNEFCCISMSEIYAMRNVSKKGVCLFAAEHSHLRLRELAMDHDATIF
jgi:hypothetical protein